MKSRRVKAAAKSKAFMSKKKLRGNLPLDVSDSGSDIDSDTFYHDDVDDFHKEQDDELSTDDEVIREKEELSSEEEVLPVTDDDTDSSENDLEKNESDEDDDLPNVDAWGRKKHMYYNADFVDEDRGKTYRERDAEAAKAEAEEAFNIQRSVLSNATADNLGTNLFLEGSSESSEDEEKREKDISSAPKHEKIQFLKKTSPEMFSFIAGFKSSMQEIYSRLLPLLEHLQKGNLPLEDRLRYTKLKYNIYMHYGTNISFYLALKSSGTKVQHHPVTKRISSYEKLLEQLKPIDDIVGEQIDHVVKRVRNDEEIEFGDSKANDKSTVLETQRLKNDDMTISPSKQENVRKPKRKHIETDAEKEIVTLIGKVKEEIKKRKLEAEAEAVQEDSSSSEEEPVDDQKAENDQEKRNITYQISKNKGLMPRRKKEYRNPRVHNRMKFKRAKISRKGQVRQVVKEMKRYEGEPTGISTHVVKSIKLK